MGAHVEPKSVTQTDAQFILTLLQNIYSGGEFGLFALLGAFLIVVGMLVYLLYAQNKVISFVDTRLRTIDTQMTAAGAIREESRAAQEFSAKEISDRVQVLTSINDELRTELDRIKKSQVVLIESQNHILSNQTRLKDDVKTYIDAGLEDIKDRISTVTVTEIMEQIPQSVKSDIESTVKKAYSEVTDYSVGKIRSMIWNKTDQSKFDRHIGVFAKQFIESYLENPTDIGSVLSNVDPRDRRKYLRELSNYISSRVSNLGVDDAEATFVVPPPSTDKFSP